MKFLIFLLIAAGTYLTVSPLLSAVYRPAAAVLRLRAPRPLTQTQLAVAKIAGVIEPRVDLEPIKRMRLDEMLKSLGHPESPEAFEANALARAALTALSLLCLVLLNPILGVGLTVVCCLFLYYRQEKKLRKEMEERRQRIERELPQFASTIRQSLNSTCDVVSILETYQKVCGPALREEIHHTLNDMVTGNPERALKALEGRVASPRLGQLTRGLVSVLRGDDQRMYFDMLASEYRKSQNEEVSKALLKRPEQLTKYIALLFVCMVLMIIASLGVYLVQQMGALF
jgi:Flp pilus assembly protein TadB